MTELVPCPVCHEDCAYVEEEGSWCVYIECGNCGTHTAFCSYDSEEEKAEAVKKVAQLWNMGRVVSSGRGE